MYQLAQTMVPMVKFNT